MRKLAFLVALAAGMGVCGTAHGQAYPAHPLTLVVPYGAGGPTDTIGRIVAERMRASLGQPVLIDNMAGASGAIGTGRVARAAADGYTLVLGNLSTLGFNGAIFSLSYDVVRDFEPVSLIVDNPLLIVTRTAVPAATLQELITWLRANPGTASLATSGAAGAAHVAGVFFAKQTGTRFNFVPYRGGLGPAMQDLVAGQIDMMIDLAANSVPQVRAGTIKAYAVTAMSRLAAAPEIPTVDEAGLPGFHMSFWHGLWVPKGSPHHAIRILNAAVVDALADPAVRLRLADLGQDIPSRERQTPEALEELQRAEIEKWWPIIRAAGIRAE